MNSIERFQANTAALAERLPEADRAAFIAAQTAKLDAIVARHAEAAAKPQDEQTRASTAAAIEDFKYRTEVMAASLPVYDQERYRARQSKILADLMAKHGVKTDG